MKCVMTVAGSDSGGGAGIQADLKTFGALGVHGVSVVTAITSQNTLGVRSIHIVPVDEIESQFEAIFEDFNVEWCKTGMLPNEETIKLVCEIQKKYGLSLVVDPVVYAESGAKLTKSADALWRIMQRCVVATPNKMEAELLSGVRIECEDDVIEAGERIVKRGCSAVVITGGHLDGSDYLITSDEVEVIRGKLVEGGTHGAGCTFSAALTSYLSRGFDLLEACKLAKEFTKSAIIHSTPVGRGSHPVDQLHETREYSERFKVLLNVRKAVDIIVSTPEFSEVIPEVGTNVGMGIMGAKSEEDVAAVSGRIVRTLCTTSLTQ